MIEIAVLREHLSLGQRSLTEMATALSVTAMVGATLYNLGFFAPIEWSMISLLTFQDLLIGASIALLPMAAAAGLAYTIARFVVNGPHVRLRTSCIAALMLVIGSTGAWYFMGGPHRSTFGHLGCLYLASGGLAAALNLFLRSKKLALIWLAFSLIYVPFAVGASDSLNTIANKAAAQTEIETDRTMLAGRVLRVTSGYVILFDGTTMNVIPLSKVRSMPRLYARSPELDYLDSMSPAVVERF